MMMLRWFAYSPDDLRGTARPHYTSVMFFSCTTPTH